jgi:hypothetical protein
LIKNILSAFYKKLFFRRRNTIFPGGKTLRSSMTAKTLRSVHSGSRQFFHSNTFTPEKRPVAQRPRPGPVEYSVSSIKICVGEITVG